MAVDLNPYSTAQQLMGPLATWVTGEDQLRLGAYAVYEAIYDNVPDSFKLVQRGSEQNPIYIPSAKTIIEAKNRFLAKRWNYLIPTDLGTTAEQDALRLILNSIFRREQLYAKFATQKRYGLIRGDSVWQVVADPDKEPGKRISVYEIDPAEYFPIEDPDNPERLEGVHLVSQFLDGNTTVIRRQTYRKEDNGGISYELTWWEMGGWDDRNGGELKKVTTPKGEETLPPTMLPPEITSIPVYHVKNNRKPGARFGISELQGLERIIAGVNQTISDEEVELALSGLGVYVTTSGPPVDDEGNEQNWKIGPGYVAEIDEDATFERVSGVLTVAPNLDHIAYLEAKMREAAGVPDIAIGSVDVATAESGIALAFKMSPILASNEEKEQELLSVMDHMLYDLTQMWIPAFEGVRGLATAVSLVDDPMPLDRKATLDEIILMLTSGIISIEFAQQLISEKLGYDFPAKMLDNLVAEQARLAEARNIDPFTARVAREMEQQ